MADRLPRMVRWLVGRWVDAAHREFFLGDLEEALSERRETDSPLRTWLWVHGQTLRSLSSLRSRPGRRSAGRRGAGWRGSLAGLANGAWDDLRLATRFQRRRPAFLAIVTLTLALGIGATTTIYSVVDAVLIRPLPWDRPDELVALRSVHLDPGVGGGEVALLSYPDVESLRESASGLSNVASWREEQVNLTGVESPQRLAAAAIDHQLFAALGVEPLLGRAFSADDDRAGGALAVILGHGLWQRRFGGDPTILGRAIQLHGEPYTVIGVMAPEMRFPFGHTELWITAAQRPGVRLRGLTNWFVIGRRAPGVSLASAITEIDTIGRHLARAHPDSNGDRTLLAETFHRTEIGRVARPLEVLLGAVLAVLLIACVNVANMLLARAGARRGDIAMRRALGATRGRLLRTFLAENALVTGLGGGLGIVLAHVALPWVLAWSPPGVPGLDRVSLDLRVVALALILTVACALVFAVVELVEAGDRPVAAALRLASRNVTRGGRLGGALVVLEVALAVVLVVGAGLLLKTLWRLSAVDAGFQPTRVLAVELELPRDFISDGWAANVDFFATLRARVDGLPGVRSASVAYQHPQHAGWRNDFAIAGLEESAAEPWSASFRPVVPGFFAAMGIPLLAGRDLGHEDRVGRPGAVVVNRAFVRRFFADGKALGRTLQRAAWWGDATPTAFEIVGIVGDVRSAGLDLPALPATYYPHAQMPVNPMTLLIRAEADPLALVEPIRSLVSDLDPNLPLGEIVLLDGALAESSGSRVFVARLLGAFAGLALALAAVGLYGVLSFAVASRRKEIGVRGALGAQSRDIARLVVARGLGLTAAGLAAGMVGALALSKLFASLLYGVAPADPVTLGAVALTLFAVAVIASVAPLRRALGVEPIEVLRQE